MASEDTLIGNDFVVQVGDGESPEVFTDLCAANDFGAVGEEKPLIDVTTYCDEARTYRNGLQDGTEIPLQLNFIPGDAQSHQLYQDYLANTVRRFRILVKNSSPAEYFEFGATVRGWSTGLPVGDKSSLTFTLKISGPVVWEQG
jgi:hypothetical protein